MGAPRREKVTRPWSGTLRLKASGTRQIRQGLEKAIADFMRERSKKR